MCIIRQTTVVLPIRTDAFASDEIDCVTQPRYAVRRHWSDADFHITQAPLSDIFQSWGLFDSFGTIGARSHGTYHRSVWMLLLIMKQDSSLECCLIMKFPLLLRSIQLAHTSICPRPILTIIPTTIYPLPSSSSSRVNIQVSSFLPTLLIPRPLPLRVNLRRKRTDARISIPIAIPTNHRGEIGERQNSLLKPQRDQIHNQHLNCKQHPSRFPVENGSTEKAESAPVVHGRTGDVEREAGDGLIHKNTKVVAQVGTGDAESPHRGQNEGITDDEQAVGDQVGGERVQERG